MYFVILGTALSSGMIYEVMKEMPILISENDLHVSQVKSDCKTFTIRFL